MSATDSHYLELLRKRDPSGFDKLCQILERNGLGSQIPELSIGERETLHIYREEVQAQAEQLDQTGRQLEVVLQKYRDLFDLAPTGYVEIDERGRLLELNLMASEMLGVPRNRLERKPVMLFRHLAMAERSRFLGWLEALFHDKEVKPFELRLGPEYEGRWYQLEGRRVNWRNEPSALLIFHDITERKEIFEQELHSFQDYLSNLVKSLPGFVYQMSMDPSGPCHLVYINQKEGGDFILPAPGLFQSEDLFFRNFAHREDIPKILEASESSRLGRVGRRLLYRVEAQDGSTHWIRDLAIPRYHSDGRIFFHGVALDVTDLMEARHLSESLYQAKLKAEQANREKSRFMAVLSHEVRTPMHNVLGFTSLMETCELGEEATEYLRCIRESGESMMVLINDILDFSRMELGHLVLREEWFSPGELLEGCLTQVKLAAAERGLELKGHLEEGLNYPVKGDFGRMRQVLVNLLNNGLKNTLEGEVGLKLHAMEAQGNMLKLGAEVWDTGRGIESDQLEKIFQPFYQIQAKNPQQAGGAGLGLSLCRKLCQAMGGEIRVESEVNAGSRFFSTFQVTISETTTDPLDPKEAKDPPEPEVGWILDKKNRRKFASETEGAPLPFLLVEDDSGSSDFVVHLFKSIGQPLRVCRNADEALLQLRREPCQMIFMDVGLPGISGIELTKMIRKGEAGSRNTDIPVVGLSAFSEHDVQERAIREGMNGFLVKPASLGDLKRVIAAHAGGEVQ